MKNCFIDHWLLAKIVRESPYALFYPCKDDEDRLGLPVVVKANESGNPRFLTCVADDPSMLIGYEGAFPVVLRFINKSRGNFIRVEAIANMMDSNTDTVSVNVEIVQIAWVYKKTGHVEFYF